MTTMTASQSLSAKAWGVAAVMLLSAAGASAQITLTNPSPTSLGSTNYVNNFDSGTTYVADWTGAKWVNDGSSTFWAYCIDPRTGTNWGGNNVYTSASLSNFLNTGSPTSYQQQMSSAGYTGLAYSIQNTTTVQNSLVSLFSHAYGDSLTSAVKAAAFGYAVWEIMGEASYSRTANALRSLGSNGTTTIDTLDTQIDAYLSALTSNSWASVNGANLSGSTNYVYTVYYDPSPHSAQNFIRVTPGTVPEPATLALVGVAAFGVVAARRRQAQA